MTSLWSVDAIQSLAEDGKLPPLSQDQRLVRLVIYALRVHGPVGVGRLHAPGESILGEMGPGRLDYGWAFQLFRAPLRDPDPGIHPLAAGNQDGVPEAERAQPALRSTLEGAFHEAGNGTDGDLTGPFVSLSPGFMDEPPRAE